MSELMCRWITLTSRLSQNLRQPGEEEIPGIINLKSKISNDSIQKYEID
jgi:hypothetical protein